MKHLALVALIFVGAANAQTTVAGSALSVQGNTLNANNGPLTLKGERADGSATAVVTIDANGWVGAKGASFNQGVDAATLNLTGAATVNGITNNGSGINNAGLVTGVSDGALSTSSQQAVNGRQLNATNTEVATKASQASVNNLTATVATNKTEAQNDATAKANAALASANSYTDTAKTEAQNDATAKANAALTSANSYTDSKVRDTNQAIDNERNRAIAAEAGLQRQINGVGAMVMATSSANAAIDPHSDNKTHIVAGVGSYNGASAVSVGVARQIKENIRLSFNVAKGSNTSTGAGVGLSFGF